jgi:SAM-dependent methyltransferase
VSNDCHLYQNLAGFYDHFCENIPYAEQAQTLYRLVQIFNESGANHYLDIACGTGQLLEQTQKFGWQLTGLDNAAAMLDQAALRCPDARWLLAEMADLPALPRYNFASCLLYSVHYNADIPVLTAFFTALWNALVPGGFCLFDCVDKFGIENNAGLTTYFKKADQEFTFNSRWFYSGSGHQQSLNLSITLTENKQQFYWQDEHRMVAVSRSEIEILLTQMGFVLTLFERNFDQIIPWQGESFNLLVVAQKPLGEISPPGDFCA